MSESKHLLGVHALVWVGGWSKAECREAISKTLEAGYQMIEIPALDPASIDTKDTRQVLEQQNVKAACSLGLSFDADINNEDSTIAKRGEERLFSALDVVEGIGGSYLGGVIFSALGKYPAPATPKARQNAIDALRRLAKSAADRGITLGLEPVNRYESNFINTVDQALDVISEIGESNVKVHADVYHMNIEEEDMRSPIIRAKNKLGYVHIGASHRGALGTGNIDFDTFFGALREIDYQGAITFESFSSTVVSKDLSNTLAIWRNLWTDNMKMARESREFIEQKIALAYK